MFRRRNSLTARFRVAVAIIGKFDFVCIVASRSHELIVQQPISEQLLAAYWGVGQCWSLLMRACQKITVRGVPLLIGTSPRASPRSVLIACRYAA
jgi:hypothetical protein